MNTTNKFFKTKEQHIAFRKAFAAAVNDPRNKRGKADQYGNKKKGWVSSSHIMLQNIVRGLPEDRGFTPISKQIRLDNGAMPGEAAFQAKWLLGRHIESAKAYVKAEPATLGSWEEPKVGLLDKVFGGSVEAARQKLVVAKTEQRQAQYLKNVNTFLEPLNGTFTIADLASINF